MGGSVCHSQTLPCLAQTSLTPEGSLSAGFLWLPAVFSRGFSGGGGGAVHFREVSDAFYSCVSCLLKV